MADMAMENFTHNTLRGMSTGGNIGSSHSNEEFSLLKDSTFKIFEKMKQGKGMSVLPLTKLVGAVFKSGEQFALNNMMAGFQPPSFIKGGPPSVFGGKGR